VELIITLIQIKIFAAIDGRQYPKLEFCEFNDQKHLLHIILLPRQQKIITNMVHSSIARLPVIAFRVYLLSVR